MSDERCQMCKEAGFPDVLAHYKAVPKGSSHDGKAHPPLCWDHKHGKMPRFIQALSQSKEPPLPNPSDLTTQILSIRESGETWKEISKQTGIPYSKLYHQFRGLDKSPQPKQKGKWSECFEQFCNIPVGETKVVALPEGGTPQQMNSSVGLNKLTQKWYWSLRTKGQPPGMVAVTKLGSWEERLVKERAERQREEEDEAEAEAENELENGIKPQSSAMIVPVRTTPDAKIPKISTTTTTENTQVALAIKKTTQVAYDQEDAGVNSGDQDGSNSVVLTRKRNIIIPGAKPTYHVELTPEIAQAVWRSLTKEERYDLLDVDSLWDEGYDDDMRMSTIEKTLLVCGGRRRGGGLNQDRNQ